MIQTKTYGRINFAQQLVKELRNALAKRTDYEVVGMTQRCIPNEMRK
jgi:hypothetical protein